MTAPPVTEDPVAVTRDGGIATVWLNRPAKRNAVTHAMWQGIAERCRVLAGDDAVRVLVVRGVGDHFCAGADIAELHSVPPATYQAATRAAEEALAGFPAPTLAVITGSCVGGGAEIAIACDLRFAATGARFGITPARLGIAYPAFALERAVRLLGPSATKHLLYSAELIDADRALRIGLVDELHEPSDLEGRVEAFTRLLAEERSGLTQGASKEMVDAVVLHGEVGAPLAARWAAEVAVSPDPAEGARAFAERRAPRFTWRRPTT